MESCRHNDTTVKDFRSQAVSAYIACDDYMQKKLPLDSKTLQSLSCLDPIVRSNCLVQDVDEGVQFATVSG